MKQFLLSILCVLFTFGLSAQTITFDNNPVFAEGTIEDWSVDSKFISTNPSATDQVRFYWDLERTDVPSEWKFTVCDNKTCYNPGWESCINEGCDVTIFEPSATTDLMKVTVQPNGVKYDGIVNFKLYNADDLSVLIADLEIHFNITGTTATYNVEQEDINIFPNPTTDYFNIDADSDFSKVSVYNIVGKEVRSYEYVENAKYNVKDLQSGLYFVRLFDEQGNANQVQRLTKK